MLRGLFLWPDALEISSNEQLGAGWNLLSDDRLERGGGCAVVGRMIGAARLWVIVAGSLKKLNPPRALPHLSREKTLAICGRDGRLGVLRQFPASSDIFFAACLAGWLGT